MSNTPSGTTGQLPLALWIARTRGSLALWREDEFRRNGYRLALTALRGLVGLRPLMALAVAACAGAWLFHSEVGTATEAFRFLLLFTGIVSMLASATMFASEQRQGTLELLWLARGSAASLVRFKAMTLLGGLVTLMIPALLIVAWFLEGRFPVLQAFVFLATNGLLIVSVMAYASTLVPHPWAGGLLGAFCLAVLYASLGDGVSFFNPFMNPVVEQARLATGGGAFRKEVDMGTAAVVNRIVVLVVSMVLLSMAGKRLRRLFR